MGTFRYPIEIGDPQGTRFERLDALVDTGASYTVVPASVLRQLGVVPTDRRGFRLGDGRRTEREVGETRVRIDGKALMTLVVFGDKPAGSALGALTLEALGLAIDPVNRRLVPVDAFLMLLTGLTGPVAPIRSQSNSVSRSIATPGRATGRTVPPVYWDSL